MEWRGFFVPVREVSKVTPRKRTRLALDPGLRPLVGWAGVAAVTAAAAYIVALLLIFVSTPPARGGAATLEYIAAHRQLYILKQVLWIAPSLLAIVVFVALFFLLAPTRRHLAAVGGVMGAVGWALGLAWLTSGEGSPTLVVLADRYAASDEATRQTLATAAEVLIAINDTPALPGIAQTLGILLISLAMLRAPIARPVTYLGIVTGAVGLVGEALRPLLGAGYALAGVLMIAWFLAIGVHLAALALQPDGGRSDGRNAGPSGPGGTAGGL